MICWRLKANYIRKCFVNTDAFSSWTGNYMCLGYNDFLLVTKVRTLIGSQMAILWGHSG